MPQGKKENQNASAEPLGPMLQRLRETHGLSQEELAEAAMQADSRRGGTLGRREISRWETGKRIVGPYWVGPLAAALGVPVQQLQRARAVSRAARSAAAQPEPTSVDQVLASLLPPGESLAPTATDTGRRIGQREANVILRRCHALRLADDVVAGGDLLAPVMRELAEARDRYTHSAHSLEVGRVLLVGIAELAQLAGWVGSDAANVPGVDPAHVLRLGAHAAREAGDRPLLGQLLGTLAYYECNRGNTKLGLDLARTLARESGPDAPARARSLADDRLAWCAVRAGDVQTALRAVEESKLILAEHEPGDDDDRRWLYWVNEDERKIMEARVYTEAHRPLRAVPLLREVLASYPPTHTRELALYQSWLTVALLDANEPEEAAATAATMMELSATVPSSRAEHRREAVMVALRKHQEVPEVAEVLANWAPVA